VQRLRCGCGRGGDDAGLDAVGGADPQRFGRDGVPGGDRAGVAAAVVGAAVGRGQRRPGRPRAVLPDAELHLRAGAQRAGPPGRADEAEGSGAALPGVGDDAVTRRPQRRDGDRGRGWRDRARDAARSADDGHADDHRRGGDDETGGDRRRGGGQAVHEKSSNGGGRRHAGCV